MNLIGRPWGNWAARNLWFGNAGREKTGRDSNEGRAAWSLINDMSDRIPVSEVMARRRIWDGSTTRRPFWLIGLSLFVPEIFLQPANDDASIRSG